MTAGVVVGVTQTVQCASLLFWSVPPLGMFLMLGMLDCVFSTGGTRRPAAGARRLRGSSVFLLRWRREPVLVVDWLIELPWTTEPS